MSTENVSQLRRFSKDFGLTLRDFVGSFRSLRWRLTLSYSLVTIAALLVVQLIVVGLMMSYFVQNLDLTPENLIGNLREEWTPMMQEFFSQEPPDIDGMRAYLEDVQGSEIGTRPLLIFGKVHLEMKAQDFLNFYYLLNDRTLVDVIPSGIVPESELGKQIPYNYLPGLSAPLRAALSGVEDQKQLYEMVEPGNRITGAIPVFRYEPTKLETQPEVGQRTVMDVERNLVGVIVFTTKHFPWEFLPLREVMVYIIRSLLIFTLFAGLLGSFFGMLTANGLTNRLTLVSQAAHDWSRGNFSVAVRDPNDDELGKLSNDLNIMAEQLETLVDRRQELSALEERNRLARDLHDSVKQHAFAASAQLGAARAHYDNNPEKAFDHLLEAETLVGKVRQELSDLIQELRPVELKGKGLVTAVREYAEVWSCRNHIRIETHIKGGRSIQMEAEKSIFRILQEALANVLWHARADQVDLFLIYKSDSMILIIQDNGIGFDPNHTIQAGMGLRFMQERAEIIGGELIIDSRPGHGTKIMLIYPYKMMAV